jgi:predicted NUDIX family NTP pyrophosphohydrolase
MQMRSSARGVVLAATLVPPGLFREDAGMATPRPARRSAGLLVHRRSGDGGLEVLLGHMGGPFWERKQERAWSVPKGEHGPDETPLAAAKREFLEETGLPVPPGEPRPLGTVRQSSGKQVTLWAVEGDLDAAAAVSNSFTMEWPGGSGRLQEFPELDRFAWVDIGTARQLVVNGQVAFLDRLVKLLEPWSG